MPTGRQEQRNGGRNRKRMRAQTLYLRHVLAYREEKGEGGRQGGRGRGRTADTGTVSVFMAPGLLLMVGDCRQARAEVMRDGGKRTVRVRTMHIRNVLAAVRGMQCTACSQLTDNAFIPPHLHTRSEQPLQRS